METLNKVITEEQVTDLSMKVLKGTIGKITDELNNQFYKELEGYMYQVYDNVKDKIRREMVAELGKDFLKEPDKAEFSDIRKYMFAEHKGEILATLTDDAILHSMQIYMMNYTNHEHYFNWKWKDNICRLIIENWDKFKDDERIQANFGREMEMLKNRIKSLELQLDEARNITVQDE